VESNQPKYRAGDPHPTMRDAAGRPWQWCGTHFVSPDARANQLQTVRETNGRRIWGRDPVTGKKVYLGTRPLGEIVETPAPQPVDPVVAAVRERHKALLVELENQQSRIEEGFVYVVTNPAWPGWVKFGSAIDPNSRLKNYQTGTPLRDYKVEGYVYSHERRVTEKRILAALRITEGEWVQMKVDHALAVIDMYAPSRTPHAVQRH
jgi:hypothetical protein